MKILKKGMDAIKAAAGRLSGRRLVYVLAAAGVVAVVGLAVRAVVVHRTSLVVVNGRVVTVSDMVERVRSSPEGYRAYVQSNPKVMVDDYINQILLYQKARRYSWKYRRALNEKMHRYYQDILVQEFVDREIVDRIFVPSEELKNYYSTHLNEFTTPAKIRMWEIVVPTEDAARSVVNRLAVGENFEEIARRESTTASRDNGGDLGFMDEDKVDPQLARLLVQIPPGQVLSQVVHTGLGYHIIKYGGMQPARTFTLEEASPSIREILISQRKRAEVEKFITDLRAKSRVEVSEKNMAVLKEKLK